MPDTIDHTPNGNTLQRVTRIETELNAVKDDVTAIKGAIGRIEQAVNRSGRTNWGNIAAFMGLAVTLAAMGASGLAFMWGMGIRPIENGLASVSVERSAMAARIEKLIDREQTRNDELEHRELDWSQRLARVEKVQDLYERGLLKLKDTP